MKFVSLVLFITLFNSVIAFASPTKKEAQSFIKELQTAVRLNDKILKKPALMTLHDHSRWYMSLKEKSEKLFIFSEPNGVCLNASADAQSLWNNKLMFFQNPKKMFYDGIEQANKYYLEDLSECKKVILKLK